MKFKFAPSLPAQLEPSTFYMIAKGDQLLEIYVTNADASGVRRIPLKEDILTNIVSQADTVPDVTGPEYFWLEPSTGMLFVKYENNGNPVWVEAALSVYTHPASHPASIITQDANNRFVTDAEKAAWNAKQAPLVSGANIKTINGESLLGPGTISIASSSDAIGFSLVFGG